MHRKQRLEEEEEEEYSPRYYPQQQQPVNDIFAFLAQQERIRLDREIAEKKEKRKRKEAKERLKMEQELKQLELKQRQEAENELRLLELKEKKKARKQKKKEAKRAEQQALEQKYALQAAQVLHKKTLLEQEDETHTHAARGRSIHRSPPRQPHQAEIETIKYYDQTNPEEIFPLKVRELARRKFPTIFAKHADDDKHRWTWSTTEQEPIYVSPNAQARTLFKQRVVRTPAVQQQYNKVRATEYYTGAAKDKNYVQDTSIATTLPKIKEMLEEFQKEESPPPSEYVIHDHKSARAQRKDIIKGLRLVDSVARITLKPDFPLSANAINKEQFEKFFPEDTTLEGIENRQTHFDGALTTWEVSIDTEVPSVGGLAQAILSYYNSSMAVFLDRDQDETPPEIITIYVFYNSLLEGNKMAEKAIPIWKGLSTEEPDLSLLLKDGMNEIIEEIGSDAQFRFEDYSINLNKFRIGVLDLIRTGSGMIIHSYEQALGSNKFLIGSKDLGWAVVYGVKPVSEEDKNCFAQALNYFLKTINWRKKQQPFTSLFREVGHIDFVKNQAVSIPLAEEITDLLGLHIEIYRPNGTLRHSKHTTNEPKYSVPEGHDRTLRLLLDNEHFLNIVEMREQVTALPTLKSKAKIPYRMPKLFTYYDLETIVEENGETMPYANAYCANLQIDEIVNPEDVKVAIKSKPSLEIFREMYNEIVNAGPGYSHHLIAYNGSRFDHIMLYMYMLRTGMSVVEGANPKGKGQSFRVAIRCPTPNAAKPALIKEHIQKWVNDNPKATKARYDKISEKIKQVISAEKSYITVWDPVLFIRNSLKNAAMSFKTEALKTGFDHKEVQRAYVSGEFEDWLEQNRDALIEYNVNDVVVLSQVTQKMFKALEDATGMVAETVVAKPSISNLAWSFWKTQSPMITLANGQKKKLSALYKPVSEEAYDQMIRDSLIAGRTECIPGCHEFPNGAILIDVVSLYPTQMANFVFPAGEEKILLLDDEEEMEKCFEDSVPGLYYVAWDQSALKDKYGKPATHPILPTRGETLDWKSFGSGEGLLPDVTIRQLLEYGAKVVYKTPPEQIVQHRWKLSEFVNDSEVDELLNKMIAKHGDAEYVVRGKEREIIWNEKEQVRAIVWTETFTLLTPDEEAEMLRAPEPFKWYVEHLSDMKNQQDAWKEAGDEQYNPALREMIKMLLNALSGKVIQRNYAGRYKLVNTKEEISDIADELLGHTAHSDDDLRELQEEYKFGVEYLMTSVDGKQYGNVVWEESSFGENSKPSHLGVFIYAHARAYMYEHVFSRCKVYYSDTDSALIDLRDYEKLDTELKFAKIVAPRVARGRRPNLDDYKLEVTGEKKFGMLEIETAAGGVWVYSSAILIAPKTYALLRNGEVVKHKCKGVRYDDSFVENGVKLKINKNPKQFYELLWANKLAGKKTVVNTWNFGLKWGKGLGLRMNEIEKKL